MLLASPVARVYSEALFGVAAGKNAVEDTSRELEAFLKLVRDNRDVEVFLTTPVLEPSVKVAKLRQALEGRASDSVTDFLCLLVEKRRMPALESIVAAFRDQADLHANRVRIAVRTARPLSDGMHREIEDALRAALAKEVVVDAEVEPALLGGAVVSVGDKLYDGSIRKRLSAFRKQIMRSGGYEAQG
jgi:F-type H+-transporting ATPase subunit delta